MKERPILFSGPMVRAILDGRKTQTRRVVKVQPVCQKIVKHEFTGGFYGANYRGEPVVHSMQFKCPYGSPGDRLWVRETWWHEVGLSFENAAFEDGTFIHKGENGSIIIPDWKPENPDCWRKRPGIHMFRWASRITLEVVGVRVERVQEISEAEAIAEGVAHRCDYKVLWDSINGKKHPWASNPFVWVLEFKRILT